MVRIALVISELQAHTPCVLEEEILLMELLKSSHLDALFSVVDKIIYVFVLNPCNVV